MRVPTFTLLVLLGACAFDWDGFDPRLASDDGGTASSGGMGAGGGSGGIAGAPQGGGGTGGTGGTGGMACNGVVCGGDCVDVDSDPDHCGDCTTVCAAAQLCAASTCGPATSCKELQLARPTLVDGSYTLDPGGGAAPYEAHCDMTIEDGGWTLVASAVDRSYFGGTRCSTFCTPDEATTCDETPFTDNAVAGDVASMLTADHKSAAYAAVAFDEMLFVDESGDYVSYDVSGASVLAWYPAGLQNWVATGTEAHDTFSYPAKATSLDPMLNDCSTLRVSFNVEDSDSQLTGSCHTSTKGPAWTSTSNGGCFWDDVAVQWTRNAFYQSNTTSYQLWLVR